VQEKSLFFFSQVQIAFTVQYQLPQLQYESTQVLMNMKIDHHSSNFQAHSMQIPKEPENLMAKISGFLSTAQYVRKPTVTCL